MIRLFALISVLLSATACASNTYTGGSFAASPGGLEQAGEIMLAHADSRDQNLTAHGIEQPTHRPIGSFWPARELIDIAPLRREMFCRGAGLSPNCNIKRAVEAVFLLPETDGGTIQRFPVTQEGARAAVEAAGPHEPGIPSQYTRAVLMLRADRQQSPEPGQGRGRISLSWRSFDPILINETYACVSPMPYDCWRREDITRLVIFPDPGDDSTLIERRVDGDLAAAYADVRAQLGNRNPNRIHAEVANRGNHRGWQVRINSVDRIEGDQFCGHMTFDRINRPSGETCLSFAEVRGFGVRIREAGPPPSAEDIVLFPFRFLGAIGQATAMGGAGG